MSTSVVTRWRYVLLAAAAVALLLSRRGTSGDWDFFQSGSTLLRGPHPLHLYASHPELQIGPLALVAAIPFTLLAWGTALVKAVIFAGGLVCIRSAELTGRALRGSVPPLRVLVGGLLFLPVWAFVATSGHLDDAMAVCGVAVAMVCIVRDRSLAAGVLLGLAIGAKPWAVLAVPVLMGLGADRRVRALGPVVAIPALAWLPFVVSAPSTARALASFHIALMPYSALHLLLGLPVGTSYPGWVRPLQFAVALVLALAVARRGAWWAVPAIAFGVRLVLDPGSITYYGAGLGAGALFVDFVAAGMPLLSLGALVGIALPTYLELWLFARDQVAPALSLMGQAAYLRLGTAAAVVTLAAASTVNVRARADRPDTAEGSVPAVGSVRAPGPVS